LKIQEQALREHGFEEEEKLKQALSELHTARYRYRTNPEVNNLTVYMREDKSKKGTLKKDQILPQVTLCQLDGKKTTLYEHINK
jgi:hypothetical protein